MHLNVLEEKFKQKHSIRFGNEGFWPSLKWYAFQSGIMHIVDLYLSSSHKAANYWTSPFPKIEFCAPIDNVQVIDSTHFFVIILMEAKLKINLCGGYAASNKMLLSCVSSI